MGRTLRNLKDVRAKRKWKDAIIIDNWDHFKEWYKEHGPSETHKIVFMDCCARLELIDRSKENYEIGGHWGPKKWRTTDIYLSTHTFYGKGSWIASTEYLHACGFEGIIIRNWDAKSEGQEWDARTYNKGEKDGE